MPEPPTDWCNPYNSRVYRQRYRRGFLFRYANGRVNLPFIPGTSYQQRQVELSGWSDADARIRNEAAAKYA